MANNYLEFSEQIDNLTSEEKEWWDTEAERIMQMEALTSIRESCQGTD